MFGGNILRQRRNWGSERFPLSVVQPAFEHRNSVTFHSHLGSSHRVRGHCLEQGPPRSCPSLTIPGLELHLLWAFLREIFWNLKWSTYFPSSLRKVNIKFTFFFLVKESKHNLICLMAQGYPASSHCYTAAGRLLSLTKSPTILGG